MKGNTLKTIQILAKIAKILSTIVFVASIIGAAGCLIGIISMVVLQSTSIIINGDSLKNFLEYEQNVDFGQVIQKCTAGMVTCAGEIFIAGIARNYFKKELEDGTPFTFDGSKQMLKMGICTVAISIGTVIIASIAVAIVNYLYLHSKADVDTGNSISVCIGVSFIIISFICKYGAEVVSAQKNEELPGSSE